MTCECTLLPLAADPVRVPEYHLNSANVIDGKKEASPTTADIINPATEEVFARVPIATPAQLDAAILAAERAFPAWSATPWEARQAALARLADLLDQHDEQFAQLLMREVGKDRASA